MYPVPCNCTLFPLPVPCTCTHTYKCTIYLYPRYCICSLFVWGKKTFKHHSGMRAKYLIYLQVLDTANHFFALPILTAASNKQTAYTLHMCCWSLKLSYRGKSSEQFSLPRTALITCEWHYDHIAWLYISDKNTLYYIIVWYTRNV